MCSFEKVDTRGKGTMKVYAWSALVCALTVGVFCGKTDAADDAKLVARIGGKTLSVQEFEERARELKQASDREPGWGGDSQASLAVR